MFSIIHRETLSSTSFLWEVRAPDLARAVQPGQFVIVRLKEGGERVPLTVADFDRERGLITLVVKVVGKTTEEMSTYPEGGHFQDLVGPLGQPTSITRRNHVVLVGGGIGVAPIYPLLMGFREQGSGTTTVIGFKSAAEILWEEKFRKGSDCLILMTEDGSAGKKGTTIDGLREVISRKPVDEVLAVGPLGMMQAVALLTRPEGISTSASMNPIMVDGIGMCGSCRVKVGEKILFACVDGPDMNAHQVDFEELKVRQKRFLKEEKAALERYRAGSAGGTDCALKAKGVPI